MFALNGDELHAIAAANGTLIHRVFKPDRSFRDFVMGDDRQEPTDT